jgi:hypothetical protein
VKNGTSDEAAKTNTAKIKEEKTNKRYFSIK